MNLARRLPYHSTTRRRVRGAQRLAALAARPGLYPTAPVVGAYWWDGHANFGDALTPWLLPRYGVMPVYTAPERARLAGIGSILEQLPPEFSGAIWGSGLLFGRPVSLPRARVVALRGPLTRELLGVSGSLPLGDPGLLVARHYERPPVRWTLGVVPHGMHASSPLVRRIALDGGRNVRVIDVSRSPAAVIRDIGRCSAVLSTSLHGLVVADSFGIPAAWAAVERPLHGGTFKFDDYEAVVTPGATRRIVLDQSTSLAEVVEYVRTADDERVAKAQAELEATIPMLAKEVDSPLLAWRHR